MFCEKCGNKLNPDDTFCNKCGNKVSKETEMASLYSNNTINSGASVKQKSKLSEPENSHYDFENSGSSDPQNLYSSDINTGNNSKNKVDIVGAIKKFSEGAKSGFENAKPALEKAKEKLKLLIDAMAKNKTLTIAICSGAACVILLIVVISLLVSGGGNNSETPAGEDDTYISQTKTTAPEKEEEKSNIEKIDDDVIESIINYESDYTEFGVYVYDINTEDEYSYNGNRKFLASAMGQVVILDTLSKAAREKDIDIESATVRFNYLPNGKEAPHSKNQDGQLLTVKECVEDVAVYGDNNKSNLIVDYIAGIYGEENGFDVINRMLSSNGYKTTEINRKTFINSDLVDYSVSPNATTPKEIGSMYYSLLYNSEFGSERYMKNIFKSISNSGEAIGIRKYVPAYYDVYNVNALTGQCTNNVAYISDGKTELIVALLSETQEDKTNIEDNQAREIIQEKIIKHILETQFQN